jgi:Sulfotransferase family
VSAADVLALRADPAAWGDLAYGSFVVDPGRIVYVETPKAACTSLKRFVAAAAGERFAPGSPATAVETNPNVLAHDRALVPAHALTDLGPDDLERILTDPSWLRFCVVRNPFGRVYSAWESKVLVGDPARLDRFGEPGAGDVVVDGHLDVRATFGAFVGELATRAPEWFADRHLRPQHQVVHLDAIPYSRVVRLEELDRFVPDLRAHLVADGAPDPGELVHANSGLGIDWRDAYDEASVAVVAALYADDFTRLGYPDDLVPGTGGASLPPVALRLLDGLRRRNRRIAQLLAVSA